MGSYAAEPFTNLSESYSFSILTQFNCLKVRQSHANRVWPYKPSVCTRAVGARQHNLEGGLHWAPVHFRQSEVKKS